jgi:non-heme chloroperoxidase
MASLHAVESRHFITVGEENSAPIDLYYEDHGSGSPVVLIHGYPLSGTSWEKQLPDLLAAGHRVITYDRRGFGKSSQPTTGYDYDTFADDLNKVITSLELRDVALVGFSMGGGEVVRYCSKFGTDRISKVAILGGVPPYLLKGQDNPDGVDRNVFNQIEAAITKDRYAFFTDFFKNFFNADKLLGDRVSEDAMMACWNTAIASSPTATLACVSTWYTDFRGDVDQVDVPTLVIHGDADRIVPLAASGAATAKRIKDARLVVVKDGPHCVIWTHPEIVNPELVKFLE